MSMLIPQPLLQNILHLGKNNIQIFVQFHIGLDHSRFNAKSYHMYKHECKKRNDVTEEGEFGCQIRNKQIYNDSNLKKNYSYVG